MHKCITTRIDSSIPDPFTTSRSPSYIDLCRYLPFFISDFTDLGLFHPQFSQICQGLFNLVYFFKEPSFCFVDSLYGFLGSLFH
jgi:hypothetical protein